MAKNALKEAIKGLEINRPFDLKGKKIGFKPPVDTKADDPSKTEVTEKKAAQIEIPEAEQPQSEAPKNEIPKPRAGFFKLSNALFSNVIVRELPGDAFKIFLWMSMLAWRFRDSKGELRASVGYISRGVGISRASVSRNLSSLENARLISVVAVDYRLGNLWKVVDLAAVRELPQDEHPETEHAQVAAPPASKQRGSIPNLKQGHSQIEHEFKIPQSTKTSHNTREIVSEKLKAYFRDMKPFRKREIETARYWELRTDFEESEIESAVEWLRAHGTLDGEKPCFLPISYLAVSMTEVLARVRSELQKASSRLEREVYESEISKQRAEQEAEETYEWLRKETQFKRMFPEIERQNDVIKELCEGSPFQATSPAGRAYAVGKWWRKQAHLHPDERS